MKQNEIIVLGLSAVAVYLIAKSKGVKVPTFTRSAPAPTYDRATEILSSSGASFDNGWRYFSDGTAIDPSGSYYKNGQMIWSAPSAGLTA